MITVYDKLIIASYFVFILAIGVMFRRLSKNTSDYFRCGGAMPWWLTGTSAWIASFSAWTFTGAAGKAYETGSLVLCLFYGNVVGTIVLLCYTSVRFRRFRTVTWMEAVRARYGPFTEQFYTWLKVPILLFTSGVGLNAIGVFMAAVFHVNVAPTLIVMGTIITLVAFAGGAWAVLASDFVQMCLIVTISLVTAHLALHQPAIGSLSSLLHKVPQPYFHWSQLARMQILAPWIGVMIWFGFSTANNMENSVMYLMAKSDGNARGMTLIPLVGSLIGPMIFLIPPLVAGVTHPHLALEYPNLSQPHEAAFVAVARDVMPQGLLGLLLCAMLGATLTSMDAGVNKGVGVFVRSFYKPIIAPRISEKRLLIVGKICTLVFGAIIVAVAVWVSKTRTIGLFDLTNRLAAGLLGPLMIPLLWGIFYKRTPAWSAWSTALVGFAVALLVQLMFTPSQLRRFTGPLSELEDSDIMLTVSAFSVVIVSSLWFFATGLFYRFSTQEHLARIEQFTSSLNTPINPGREAIANYDEVIYRLIGGLCLVYGSFILLLTAIPNSMRGRMCFVFCGGVIFIMGAILRLQSRGHKTPEVIPAPAAAR